MKTTLQKCTLVVRRLGRDAAISESDVEVASLEQLFDECLSLAGRQLPERLVVEGRDARGRRRSLTFTFQSASERD
jgi:NADPH-dependent glutamate synthase beta subunit-like oxidoreductase